VCRYGIERFPAFKHDGPRVRGLATTARKKTDPVEGDGIVVDRNDVHVGIKAAVVLQVQSSGRGQRQL
jgi:hypothetical protein